MVPTLSPHVFIPTCEMLCAMKILSLLSRGEHHKIVKDLCDLYSLIWFTDTPPEKIQNELSELLEPKAFQRLNKIITTKLMKECEYYLGEPEGSVQTVIHQLL